MYQRKATADIPLVPGCRLADEPSGDPEETRVECPEEHSHDQREHEHRNRRLRGLLARWPDNLADLDARPLDKVPEALSLGARHADRDADNGSTNWGYVPLTALDT